MGYYKQGNYYLDSDFIDNPKVVLVVPKKRKFKVLQYNTLKAGRGAKDNLGREILVNPPWILETFMDRVFDGDYSNTDTYEDVEDILEKLCLGVVQTGSSGEEKKAN